MAPPPGLTSSPWARLNGPQRIGGVDLARGLAVLGMFAAHLISIDPSVPFALTDPSSWIAVVNGRSSILFATLAGVSIGIVTGGRHCVQGEDLRIARLRLVVRACLLWLLGVALIATEVPVYVILPAYAILFLLALPFVRLPAGVMLGFAGGLALVMPLVQVSLEALPIWVGRTGNDLSLLIGWHYPFPVWIAFVLAGLGVARAGVMRTSVQLWMLGAGAVLALIGYGLDAATGADETAEQQSLWGAVWTARPHSSGVLEVIGSGGFAIAVIGACLLVCRTVLTWVVLPLRAVGAMPLTAYTAQLLVWAAIASAVLEEVSDLRGFRDLDPFWPFAIGTILGCTAWALLVGRGPLEWAVDRISRIAVPAAATEGTLERQ